MALISAIILFAAISSFGNVYAMDNGLARTPPMGWLAWERFRCNTNCKDNPDGCVSEKLFMEMADVMERDGWVDAGYNLVNMDDCWMARSRNAQDELYPDPERFPSGMRVLADYVHSKGLKLGIYADFGNHTCSGYPGSIHHLEQDAQTFADWGIDMLKFDGCESTSDEKKIGYPAMSKALNDTGRPIIFSCSWPAEDGHFPPKINFTLMGEICNLWRNYNDIGDNFDDVVNIMNWFGDNQDILIPAAGPGGWNDPDMIVGGNYDLSYDQAKLQLGIWAMLAAPLFLSADLRVIRPDMRELLQNKYIIKIDQDRLGIPGRRVKVQGSLQLWVRPLWGEEQAIAVVNLGKGSGPAGFSFTMASLGIKNPDSVYLIHDIMNDKDEKVVGLHDTVTVSVNPTGITIYKAKPRGLSHMREPAPHVQLNVDEEIFFDML